MGLPVFGKNTGKFNKTSFCASCEKGQNEVKNDLLAVLRFTM